MLTSLKIMYQGTIIPIIVEVIPIIDTELQSTLDKLKKSPEQIANVKLSTAPKEFNFYN